jgi:hypothetical protein
LAFCFCFNSILELKLNVDTTVLYLSDI